MCSGSSLGVLLRRRAGLSCSGLASLTEQHKFVSVLVDHAPCETHCGSPSTPHHHSLTASNSRSLTRRSSSWPTAVKHTVKQIPSPASQALSFLAAKDQLVPEHLTAGLAKLADEFISVAHHSSLTEVCTWCEVCRQLEFVGRDQQQIQGVADAVRGALEGRVQELEPQQLASMLWLLASADEPLEDKMEQELVDILTTTAATMSPLDLLDSAEAANRLALSYQPKLASGLVHAAVARLPSCNPQVAVRLASACLPSALPHNAPERALLLGSICQHLARQADMYDTNTLSHALKLVGGLAAGQQVLQEYVRTIKSLLCPATPTRAHRAASTLVPC